MNSTSTYTRILDNLKFLKSTESINVIDKTMEYVNKNNLNFIDGFLFTRDDSKLFFQLIDRRYERNSTIVTTNINSSRLQNFCGAEEEQL